MAFGYESYQPLPLLPYRFRFVGYALILLSFGAAYLYFWGGRPAFFEVPIFAIATSYVETRWFVLAQTNLLDELAVVFAILGLMCVGFSRELKESKELDEVRSRSLFYSVYITSAIWTILYLTIFGWPMIVVSATIFIVFLTTYIIVFRLQSKKLTKTGNQEIDNKKIGETYENK